MDDDELQKPFGRPSGWPRELGKGVRIGVHAPPGIHEILKKPRIKKVLGRMATEPDFLAEVLKMVDDE